MSLDCCSSWQVTHLSEGVSEGVSECVCEEERSMVSDVVSGLFRDLLHHLSVYVCSQCDLRPLQKPSLYLRSAS